jgi:hypothetical protein
MPKGRPAQQHLAENPASTVLKLFRQDISRSASVRNRRWRYDGWNLNSSNKAMSKPAAISRVNTGESLIGQSLMIGISLLLGVALALAAFDYAVPQPEDGTQGGTRRLGWYLRSGQWQADVHTAVAAFQFLVNSEPDYFTTPLLNH